MRVGLNPYGLTWLLGLQGRGTARVNPQGRGLDGFLTLAEEIDAGVLEIFDPWLREMDDDDLRGLAAWLKERDIVPVVSSGVDMMGPMDSAFRSARLLGAATIRLGLTPVLCGARNAWGTRWDDLVARVREVLEEWGPRADDEGRVLAIENHQDFTSGELVAFCESARGIGITFDTGNAFPVAEAPLDFTRAVAAHVRHVHLKDYRAQFTDEGFQLIRCAIGDGAVPFVEMLEILEGESPDLTAVLEPGALEARHVRLLTPAWWKGYPPKTGQDLAACLRALRVNRIPEGEDCRTPWEREADAELETYELDMIRRSVANMRALGIM